MNECTVKVMQWNIHHGEDVNGRIDLKKQADVILRCNPDVVAINEVDKNSPRTNFIDTPAMLATLSGMIPIFGATMVRPPEGLYGNLILSRFKVNFIGSWLIPAVASESRGVTLVEIMAPQPFYLAVTHFSHRQNPEENAARVQQAQAILTKISQFAADRPAIIIGDLNCAPDSDPIKAFEAAGYQIGEPLLSHPADAPDRALDYIVYNKLDKRLEVIDRHTVDEKVASDHLPLVNTLKIKAE
ncbi:MAG: endonuclease/exonuclease/phosphatase family protein [Lentisphaeria bacterium]|nr:endonuclease/exonuclease/phosphatase family protein [Lentisphaeria bacterium]